MENKKKSGFSGSIGFVLSAAGSAVGVGNIWRFPYLAAQDGGGLFILVYLILVLTFGFTLLTTDIAIGRRTQKNPMKAFASLHPKWDFLGKLTFLVPAIIMTYYSVIGGWILKYIAVFLTGQGVAAAQNGYFDSFISAPVAPVVFMLAFLAVTAFIVYSGVEKGVERFSKLVMPGLLVMILGISIFSLTLRHTDADGTVRTGLQGMAVYLIPDFSGLTLGRFLKILLDAMSQLFFSLSVAMGIMITYGTYVDKNVNLSHAISQIEIFDTGVALLAGAMIIPAIYVFSGTEGMTSGPGLMFVSLPKVFQAMGSLCTVLGVVFFVMVALAALTSSVSIMETLVASCMEMFHTTRKKMSLLIGLLSAGASTLICMGYNVLYFKVTLPNGTVGQLLDVMDYVSNSFLMPLISLLTCILVGWVIKPRWIAEEMESSGHIFRRKRMYGFMIRYAAPVILVILFLQSTGIL
ncbi:MAG: sodium-dependent transporter [Oscillospiraceae bacterium]|nr:sodium-dependent transporter [Oscillospiraceae bacterium]